MLLLANRLKFGTLRLLPWRTYFYSGLGSVLQDHEQGIKIQTNLGIGIGRYLKNTDHVRLSVLACMAWQNTAYQPSTVPIARQNVGASMIAANLKAFVFKRTNLSVNALRFSGCIETRTRLLGYERDLLHKGCGQFVMECVVLRELGQPAAGQTLW
jgi:Protein of unknown function, DUF481